MPEGMNIDHEGAIRNLLNNPQFLKKACDEILDWNRTGVLDDGIVRNIEEVYFSDAPETMKLRMAENAVKDAALRYCKWKI